MRPKQTFNDSIWNAYELKDIVSFSKGKNVSLDIVTETGFPAMMYGDIYIKYDTFFDKVDYCIPIELSKNSTIIDKNTILMTCTGETSIDIGKSVCYLGETPICIGGDILALKCTDNTDAKFLCLQLNTYDKIKERARLGQGHSVVHLYQHHIEKSKIYKPDIVTQTKIATFLNLYYKKIELLNKKLNLLKLRKEGFLQRVFRKQYPNIYKLNAILKERSIYSSDKQMYTHATLSKDGVFPKTERYNRDFLVKDEEKKYKITYKNDICYNPANLKFGVICLNNYGTLIFSPIYVTFEINTNLTDITYISHLLTWNETIQKLRKYEEGTVYERMAVSSEDFVKLTITLPAIQEQKNISQKILSFDKEIDLISNKINLLEKYKQGLLQKLFI